MRMEARTDNPGQPTCGHRTSRRSPTGGNRGGNDTFCGAMGGPPVASGGLPWVVSTGVHFKINFVHFQWRCICHPISDARFH